MEFCEGALAACAARGLAGAEAAMHDAAETCIQQLLGQNGLWWHEEAAAASCSLLAAMLAVDPGVTVSMRLCGASTSCLLSLREHGVHSAQLAHDALVVLAGVWQATNASSPSVHLVRGEPTPENSLNGLCEEALEKGAPTTLISVLKAHSYSDFAPAINLARSSWPRPPRLVARLTRAARVLVPAVRSAWRCQGLPESAPFPAMPPQAGCAAMAEACIDSVKLQMAFVAAGAIPMVNAMLEEGQHGAARVAAARAIGALCLRQPRNAAAAVRCDGLQRSMLQILRRSLSEPPAFAALCFAYSSLFLDATVRAGCPSCRAGRPQAGPASPCACR